jgi:pimeloyl-ACP methyl ester carboxylesterase
MGWRGSLQGVPMKRENLFFPAMVCLALLHCSGHAFAQSPDCEGIAARPPAGMSLSAEKIAGDTIRPPGPSTGPMLVEHCRITGRMAERTGVDGKPYHIGFELRLPTVWNGRLLYQGGGGNDGVIRPAVGAQAAPGYALNRGFAVVSTDAGHQGASADFGFDPIARIDHAYNAHDRVAVAAKALVQQYYRSPAEHAYFIGCSGGGRQGMMFTQRFPSYFDGVIAIAPAMKVSKSATIAAAWDTQQLTSIAPPDADGNPILSRALTETDLGVLRDGILDACDADDGLADGLVSNPAACTFRVESLACADGQSDACLAPAQTAALEKMFAGPHSSDGTALYASWPWDPGIGHPRNDWRTWRLGTSETAEPNSVHATLMQDALRRHFTTPPDSSLNLLEFDFDTDPARMDANEWITGTSADAELAEFHAAGGKLLLAHGLADPIFSPHDTIDYYERMSAAHGPAVTDFSRLFLIAGMSHCQGGAATDSWDGLAAIVDWVENDRAPERIVASGTTVYPERTRPLCPYPAYARYDGSGDPESESSFVCQVPEN